MSLSDLLQTELSIFERKTEGVLGSCILSEAHSLVLAEGSATFATHIIEGMSARLMELGNGILKMLLGSYVLQTITITEEKHLIFFRAINKKYFLVVVTNTVETAGLREMNMKELIKRLQPILAKA